ncbi:rhomboid family intramembrane serine protease [Clostridium sp.]|uniref:rhomboid family intramembrane serine protease n=1 Tax=Clostridium sp. TaxID=1506 RepID=UPI002601F06E|nr:rhomboid family intramembrane serine protease [Clostridium sp.]
MKDFKEQFYKVLLNKENFYMKQYYSNFHKKEIFLAIKELQDGIYCVLISDEENEIIDYTEVIEYIKTLNKAFLLNMIILSNKEEYTYINDLPMAHRLVINKENYNTITCDRSCIPLRNILEASISVRENKDKNNFSQYQVLTYILIGINIIIFLLTAFLSFDIYDINTDILIDFGAKVNILINQGQIWRLFTCAFLHSGLIHIACNMYSLYIIGPQIQQIFGTVKYLLIYACSCITASLLSYYMSPNSISVGASGAIFGLMGALLAFAIIERNRIQKRFLFSIMQVIAINLFIGLSIKNIDNFAHIGGLIGGGLIGYISYRIPKKVL